MKNIKEKVLKEELTPFEKAITRILKETADVCFKKGQEFKLTEVGKVVNDVEDKFAETEVSGYSEGYSSGWIACATLIKRELGIK